MVRGSFPSGHTMGYLLLTLGALTMVLPFVWMVSTSLRSPAEILAYPYEFLPREGPQWRNYLTAFRQIPFGRFYINSSILSVAHVTGMLISSSLAGYAFARIRFVGRDPLFLIYLGSMMVPFYVRLIPTFLIMKKLGWVDTYYGLILPGLTGPFGTFLLRQFFVGIPVELEEAARIDGCNRFGIFLRIVLPLSKPALATLAIFTFLGSWNDFLWPLIVTNSITMRPLSVGLTLFVAEYHGQTAWHLLMAGATMSVIPSIIVFILNQRFFVRGIAVTGLKQ